MIDDWRKLFSFFPAPERFRIMLLLVSSTISGLMQAVGIASIMPFIAVVADPTLITSNPYLSQLDNYFQFENRSEFRLFLGLFAMLVLIATNVLIAVNAWLTFRVCHMGEHDLARRLLRKYLKSPYQLLLQRNSSELLKLLVSEIERVIIGTMMAGIGVFSDVVETVFIVALLLWLDPWVTVVTLIVLALAYGIIYLLVIPKVTQLGSEFATLNTETYKNASEALGAAKEIKMLGCEEHFVDRFSVPLLRLSKNAIRYSTLDIIPAQSLELIAFGGLFGAALYMMASADDTASVIAELAMFGFAAYRLIPALKDLLDGAQAVRYNMEALEPLWRDYSAPDESRADEPGDAMTFHKEIRLENVFFRYPGAPQEALSGIELSIRAGTAICLAGPTGAGKSTTIDVLLGLLQPSQGRVIVDGVPLAGDNLRAWQRNIGYMPQVAFVFDDTVASNIALGVDVQEIDMKRVEQVARIAEIHEFIVTRLSEGYQTVVGERGVNLSGGQRQRIGIARALYRDPAVLVLDESTNELDLVTQGRILESLRRLGNKTLIFASHRPSVAVVCNEIIVIEGGRVVAHGDYATLTASGSRYRTLLQNPERDQPLQ